MHSWNFVDLTGKVFGKWTVLRLGERRLKNLGVTWLCRCECLREKIVPASDLTNGCSTQCRFCADHHLPAGKSIAKRIGYDYRIHAIRRGYQWMLTQEQFEFLIQKNCHYCGTEPRRIVRKKAYGELVCNGLDRSDNSKGYTIENVVPCCLICNRAKNTMSVQEFREWIEKVYHHGKSTPWISECGKQD